MHTSEEEWEKSPQLDNYSCWGGSIQAEEVMKLHPTPGDIARTSTSLVLGLLVLISNCIFLFALNHRGHVRHLPTQSRYLLSSLGLNELLKGLLVSPLAAYPSIYHCWPYPRFMCAVQALLLPILLQNSALCLTLLAVDRYYCLTKPGSYGAFASRLMSISMVLGSWTVSVLLYLLLFLPSSPNFYFNSDIGACEAMSSNFARLTFAACFLYFPTTMIMMYCYGTAFHTEGTALQRLVGATVTAPHIVVGASIQRAGSEREYQLKLSRVMAVLSLSFVIFITPWTLRQIIAACTSYKMPVWIDFSVWIISETAGLLMLGIYWLLSPALRRATEHTINNKVCCGNVLVKKHEDPPTTPRRENRCKYTNEVEGGAGVISREHRTPAREGAPYKTQIEAPERNLNGKSSSTLSLGDLRHKGKSLDLEEAGERFWGEILERATSSTSLHHPHRIYRQPDVILPPPPAPHDVYRNHCQLHPRGYRIQ